ncbi:hypothetical protein FHW79_005990 [Azospirillum sp. OGB3]|uniref:Uncharacterized protein n=1 Tax=Azospirillum argentinense TaxID=2970906 RepID=A0A5B0KR35_9PROT|nr:hypothetical protein [Azospirillum argentinense]KAA1053898.1 hypothetical protein FH063_002480 [Azospirillum argentinense]MBB3268315.1 hypothetical protein [Azospirillum sp. OGB3]
MEPVTTQVRGLASGTLAHLSGQSRHEQINTIRTAFIRFVDETELQAPGTLKGWPAAWAAFTSSTAYPLH